MIPFNFPIGVTESLNLCKSNSCWNLSTKSRRTGRWKSAHWKKCSKLSVLPWSSYTLEPHHFYCHLTFLWVMDFCKLWTQRTRNGYPLQWTCFESRRDRQRETSPVEEKRKKWRGISCWLVEQNENKFSIHTSSRIKDDGSNPRGRDEHLQPVLGFQVFLGLWEKKRRTRRDPRMRNSIWWGLGSIGLPRRLSFQVRAKAVAMGRESSSMSRCWRTQ